AQAITDDSFAHLGEWLVCGHTEQQCAMDLEYWLRSHGADGLAFESIIASGPNAANPHAVPSGRVLEAGDLVVCDYGARYHGYDADMTRTVCVGKPTDEQRRIYDATLAAQTAVLEALKPGVTGAEMHQLAADTMDEYGDYSKYFMHALGHGVGLFIHEEPTLAPRVDKPLVPGNVVTVEPGIYVKGLCGVRIEDYGVITQDGFEDFTRSPHRLITLA
ncbi:MAG: aminopeptidase P family protein, partial [Coriobacteriales bacterium]|nr:aminopeptidase P family protein [Coriobacteriales bacterium]